MSEYLIERYKAWLSRPFIATAYFPTEREWGLEVQAKIEQLKLTK